MRVKFPSNSYQILSKFFEIVQFATLRGQMNPAHRHQVRAEEQYEEPRLKVLDKAKNKLRIIGCVEEDEDCELCAVCGFLDPFCRNSIVSKISLHENIRP
jgi:hypothetical protein